MTGTARAILLAFGLLGALVAASSGQTERGDRVTRDALDAIDAVPVVSTHAATQEPSRDRIVDWPGLIRFFGPGLIVAAAIGAAGSVFGTFVLLRRDALVALALPQVVALGAAVGMRVGWPTLPPALVAVVAALAYFVSGRRRDAAGGGRGAALAAPALYVAGLCGSFLVIAHGGQHVEELQNLFTGIDVAVTPAQAAFAAPALFLCAAIGAGLWRRWLLIAQAPAAAELGGVRVRAWDALFLSLLSIVVLVGTSAQGSVMVLAMLFLPPVIVAPWARRLPGAMAAGVAAAWLALAIAFACSVSAEWPLSHSVGGVAFVGLILSNLARAAVGLTRRDRDRRRQSRGPAA